ncbi:hypothetical protein CC80DRAFT_55526 [Byssothecium circinans]|uniref:Tudor domain-containing protein n=1 Tax=Byssothecium circinans TaxID=147558 RepID=A0A6A5U2D1_9PLEO|nr:hypothetical protein CC80DRAFT_55526 [Byssothecium circinans]
MDEIKEIKKDIWRVKQSIETEEKLKASWVQEKKNVQQILEADPHNETASLLPELEQGVAAADAVLQPLYEKLAALEAQLPQAPEAAVRKFDPAQHPILKKTIEKTEPAKPVVFSTGDICEAQWHDKAYYKVKIQAVLGSASAPKYHVKFLDYDDTMTVDRDAMRSLQSKRKREEAAAPGPTPQAAPLTSTPAVISGPVSVNPNAQATNGMSDADATQPRKKKIKNSKALEKSVGNWKDWTSKGKGKKLSQKESMFRTGTNAGSRVGFTGSGSGMTETQKRVRYDSKADVEAAREEHLAYAQDRNTAPYFGTYPSGPTRPPMHRY